jgi:uncharacterized protein (TIGR02646 family)
LGSKLTHEEREKYLAANPIWRQLKDWLVALNYNKCWYCEASVLRAPLDVDHFRPKLATTVDRARLLAHEGYYWLAYDWLNFRLACQRCNRPENDETKVLTGKANEFPIKDEITRCSAPGENERDEEPRFLDPCNPADEALLGYGLDGEAKPTAEEGTWEYFRARYTIDTLGFNSYQVPEYRRGRWLTISALINLVGDGPPPPYVEERIVAYLSTKHEYSRFFRSVIGTYRDREWVDALLCS